MTVDHQNLSCLLYSSVIFLQLHDCYKSQVWVILSIQQYPLGGTAFQTISPLLKALAGSLIYFERFWVLPDIPGS